jgi:hypothetical protein
MTVTLKFKPELGAGLPAQAHASGGREEALRRPAAGQSRQ